MNLDDMIGFIKGKYPGLKLWPLQQGERSTLEQEYKRKTEEFGPGPLERAKQRRTLWGWVKSKIIPPKVKKDGWY